MTSDLKGNEVSTKTDKLWHRGSGSKIVKKPDVLYKRHPSAFKSDLKIITVNVSHWNKEFIFNDTVLYIKNISLFWYSFGSTNCKLNSKLMRNTQCLMSATYISSFITFLFHFPATMKLHSIYTCLYKINSSRTIIHIWNGVIDLTFQSTSTFLY